MRDRAGKSAWILAWALAAGLCQGCAPVGSSDTPHDPPLEPVTRGRFVKQLLLTGELEAVRSISVKSPQTSLFQMRIQFMAEEGSIVEPGDPLLDFDNSSLAARVRDLETSILDAETRIVSKRNELASAMKDLEIRIAELEYEHGRAKLDASVDPQVVADKEYSERQLAFRKAAEELEEIHERVERTRDRGTAELDVLTIERDKLRADLLSAREDLDLLSIKAPTRGLVVYNHRQGTSLRFQEGDSCWPGQGILELPDLSEMQAVLWVNEVDAPALTTGTPLSMRLDSFPGRELGGRIEQIPSMAIKRRDDSKIALFRVVASLDETWVGEMKPGMSVLGTIVVAEQEGAPLVSRSAVRFDGEVHWLENWGAAAERIEPLDRTPTHYLISEDEFARLIGGQRKGEPS
jgi:multidrug efflux pump subunit AcrA (membrane-fusion protein)